MRLGRSATKESLWGRKDLCLKFPSHARTNLSMARLKLASCTTIAMV